MHYPEELPIVAHRQEIVQAIRDIARGSSSITSLSIAQPGWTLDACKNH